MLVAMVLILYFLALHQLAAAAAVFLIVLHKMVVQAVVVLTILQVELELQAATMAVQVHQRRVDTLKAQVAVEPAQ